ncbi:ankyrin repeat domain-containing protein [Marimonas sp. MJW-29]|uniref:Ankyrin repeat domain-containing protein n=1 Tax=Sulfitobacter sediminis TaxID=3234186 RepID=A0ABV3RUT3_9RHOB
MHNSKIFVAILTAITLASTSMVVGGPLHDAARNGDTAALEKLLNDGADVNAVEFATPLQMAAFSGQADAVELLISRGADLNMSSSAMGTALHAATSRGHAGVVEILLTAGADTDARNADGYTPLMIAALEQRLEALQVLIAAGADIEATAVASRSPKGGHGNVNALHLGTFKVRFSSPDRDAAIADALLKAGAGPRPIPLDKERMSKSDPNLGRELTIARCGGCHKVESESEAVTQPEMGHSLVNIFGRRVASRDDVQYSDALKQVGGTWTEELLFSFVAEPMLTVPGTRMRWQGDWSRDDVAHIVSYLMSAAR